MGEDRKTEEGHAVPATDAPLGTIQMRPGQVLDDAPAVMATVTGSPVVTHAPPAIPPPRYELGDEIARGGMGRVVEATDTLLGRTVALKEALSLDPEALRRFHRETKITARLEHPSIVPVHDAGEGPNGAPYYVMRKIGGQPLEDLVRTGENLNARLALIPHIVAAAQAIAHAHERGIVHRDIKPANILVGELGETIVIDWGLAKVIGEADELSATPSVEPLESIKTRAGIVFGTPGFMAPEQLRGNPVDPRCDVYALGATLYHLLSRKPPHHAKTADEMMRAAVNAAPTPIGDLVSGVPPELSTIIDKSLAFDPTARYQDARELAEDLQRFLTGQLVASHHYTTSQKLKRLVKKHKVATALTALIVVLILGAFSKVRVERDRADAAAVAARRDKQIAEDERALAQRRNDQLTLSHARNIAASDPTLAVAMIKPLATATEWREVRTIAAAARAAGVAWSLPASAVTRSLEMSRDGLRAVAAGEDGVVRLYDFARRTQRTIVELGTPVSACFADGERKIVVWHDAVLTVVDAASLARRDFAVPTQIVQLQVIGITAYWVDVAGALWQLDLAGTNPLQVPLDEKLVMLAPSPDGRWIALGGASHLMLFDRTQPASPPQEITTGETKHLDWSSDGGHLAALVDELVIDVVMTPEPTLVQRLTVGNRYFVAFGNGRVYTLGPTGVAIVSRDGSRARAQLTGRAVGLHEARGGTMIAGSEASIAVLSERGDQTLSFPTSRMSNLHASPRSPYVIATADDRLLVWNLDEFEPRAIATEVESAHFAGKNLVLTTGSDAALQWIDVATGKVRELEGTTALTAVAYGSNSPLALIVDLGHRARLLVRDQDSVDLGSADPALIGVVNDHQVLLGQGEGTLHLHDARTGKRTNLIDRKTKLLGIAWSRSEPTWVAAVFLDATLWRKNLATGAEGSTRLPKVPNGSLVIRPDGTVVYGAGMEIRTWRPNDSLHTHASLPRAIVDLGEIDAGSALAFSEQGDAYRVDLDRPNRVVDLKESFDGKLSVSRENGMIVEGQSEAIDVIDPLVEKHGRWPLARMANVAYSEPQISHDGRLVIAKSPASLLLWSIELPSTQADTVQWLDQLTNAVTESGAKSVGWK